MDTRSTRKRLRADVEENPFLDQLEEGKIQRAIDDSGAPNAQEVEEGMKKDDEFWFEDGTVILVAGDVEFRVFMGLLANRSAIFKDLFAQTHPMRAVSLCGQQRISCPVVTLTDSAHD